MRVRAARLEHHSGPLTVEEIDLPDPRAGEVVVEMSFAGVNPVDRYQAEGRVAPDAPLPRTLGVEGAGLLDGRAVMVRGRGLWATAAVVPEGAVIPVPEGVRLEEAAAMGIAGVTAWRCATEKARLGPEDRVLVLGASGGVGSILVSIARSVGATVWGHTGNGAKVDWIRERGASEVVVGDADRVAEAAAGLEPTVVFDPLGERYFGAAVRIMADKGRLVAFGTSAGPEGVVPLQLLYRKALTVHGYGGLIESDEDLAAGIRSGMDALRDGRMEVVIDRVVPLDEVNEALALITDRALMGKVVLDLRTG